MPKYSLAEEQKIFTDSLKDSEKATPEMISSHGNNSLDRFNIYRNNVFVSLTEAIASSFPACFALVGENFFNALARAYIDEVMPQSPLIYLYAEKFPDFLQNFTPAKKIPYLADLARLEWEFLKSTHAKDAVPLMIDELQKIEADHMPICCFTMHPSLFIGQSNWQIADLWIKIRHDPARSIEKIEETQFYLIIRPHLQTQIHIISKAMHNFMRKLSKNISFAQASEETIEAYPDFNLGENLAHLFSLGCIEKIT